MWLLNLTIVKIYNIVMLYCKFDSEIRLDTSSKPLLFAKPLTSVLVHLKPLLFAKPLTGVLLHFAVKDLLQGYGWFLRTWGNRLFTGTWIFCFQLVVLKHCLNVTNLGNFRRETVNLNKQIELTDALIYRVRVELISDWNLVVEGSLYS